MKEVIFIYVFVTILSKPILYVQWLSGFPFYEVVILYNLFFQKLHPFFYFLFYLILFIFCVCLAYSLKN